MPIYGGDNPSALEGVYQCTPLTLVSSTRPEDRPSSLFNPLTLTFFDQDNERLEISVSYEQISEQGSGIASYVVGNECEFSVFTPTEGSNDGSPFKAIYVFSGTIASDGIIDFYLANFMLDDFGDTSGKLIRIGEGRVIRDRDAFSPREGTSQRTFYSALPNCPCNVAEARQLLGPTTCPAGEWQNCEGASQAFHYGAADEVRWTPAEDGAPGQQCTYDEEGDLITGGIAAGSPDKVAPQQSCDQPEWLVNLGADIACGLSDHCQEDVVPWESIPCWRYLSEWPANNACGQDNVVSGIDHMRDLVGRMTCEEVTLLLMAAHDASFDHIDISLQRYILGISPDAFTSSDSLFAAMDEWYLNESCLGESSDKCQVIQRARNNL